MPAQVCHLYYPVSTKYSRPHATSAIVSGEIAMVKRLLGALRTGHVATADAVDDFDAEVTPWLGADGSPPAKHMVAGLVIEGFK